MSVIFSLLGRRYLAAVYGFLPMITLVRGVWVYVRLHMVIEEIEPFYSLFDFSFVMS